MRSQMLNDLASNILKDSNQEIGSSMNTVALIQVTLNMVISAGLSTFLNMIGALNIVCF